MSLRRLTLLFLVLTGCQEELRFMAHPPGAGTMALAVREGARVQLWIMPRSRAPAIELEIEDVDQTELAAVVFEADEPAALALPEGLVPLEPSGPRTRGLPLDESSARFYVGVTDGAWVESDFPPPLLEELHLRDPRICPEIHVETVVVPGTQTSQGFLFGAILGPEAALLAHDEGRVFRVDGEMRVTEVEVSGHDAPLSAFATHGDELWVGTSSGAIFRAPLMKPSLSVNVGAMTAFSGGVLLGHTSTGVELIYPDRELLCGPLELEANLRSEFFAPLGRRLLLSGNQRSPSDQASLVFFSTGGTH